MAIISLSLEFVEYKYSKNCHVLIFYQTATVDIHNNTKHPHGASGHPSAVDFTSPRKHCSIHPFSELLIQDIILHESTERLIIIIKTKEFNF